MDVGRQRPLQPERKVCSGHAENAALSAAYAMFYVLGTGGGVGLVSAGQTAYGQEMATKYSSSQETYSYSCDVNVVERGRKLVLRSCGVRETWIETKHTQEVK